MRRRTPRVERRPQPHHRRRRLGETERGVLHGPLPHAHTSQRPQRRERRLSADGKRRHRQHQQNGRRQRPLHGILPMGHLPQPAPAADPRLPRPAGGDGKLHARHLPRTRMASEVGAFRTRDTDHGGRPFDSRNRGHMEQGSPQLRHKPCLRGHEEGCRHTGGTEPDASRQRRLHASRLRAFARGIRQFGLARTGILHRRPCPLDARRLARA